MRRCRRSRAIWGCPMPSWAWMLSVPSSISGTLAGLLPLGLGLVAGRYGIAAAMWALLAGPAGLLLLLSRRPWDVPVSVPREPLQRDPDRRSAGQDARERDRELHPDREREHRARRRGVSEHVAEEGLLRPEPARGERKQRRGALGRKRERRVDEVGRDPEGLEEEVHREGPKRPAGDLDRGNVSEVAARRPQDREPQADTGPERDD